MKYKLIKEYPGSPKLGNIIDNLENDWIENYPEFWQPVVEKNYEILSYITIESELIKYKDLDIDDDLNCDKYLKIYSVKRLSDGEIFTIGDKVVGYNNSIAKIKTIDLVGEISLNIGTDKHEGFSLKNLKKVKQPLFTTEDGVDIFEGDISFGVNSNFKLSEVKHINKLYIYPNVKEFSTKEKAEEYILLNKPVLSYGEVQEYLKVKDCNKVLDLAQSKYNSPCKL